MFVARKSTPPTMSIAMFQGTAMKPSLNIKRLAVLLSDSHDTPGLDY